jgi:hypothetical protein
MLIEDLHLVIIIINPYKANYIIDFMTEKDYYFKFSYNLNR